MSKIPLDIGDNQEYHDLMSKISPTFSKGDRIVLDHTTHSYTYLTPGERGSVSYISLHGDRIGVNWDNGSTLTMLPDNGDRISKDNQ